MVIQCAIIFGCLALGELVVWLTGIKLPSSIIGMLILALLLQVKAVKLRQVEGMANFLVKNFGFFFVPAAVSLMLYLDIICAQWLPILVASAVSTVVVIVVTGWIHQLARKFFYVQKITAMEYLSNTYFLLALTFAAYALSQLLQWRTQLSVLNPILISAIVIIAYLKLTNVSIESYNGGGRYIEFWPKPAIVALGVPLYKQLSTIRKQLLPLIISELAGCVAGIISVVLVARLLGATQEVVMSLAAKSVTTPIAMEVTKAVGGIPSLTAAVVICVGIFGGMTGFKVMKMTRIGSPIAQGLSLGTAAHAMGTSRAMDVSDKYGAFASLGLTINGIFTALLTPTVLSLLD